MLTVDIEKKLSSFTLRVKLKTENDFLALLGASGAGKSMTLKCIAGIEKPDRGVITLDGVTLFDSEKKINLKPQERKIGYLFQDYALFPNMTVKENILAGLTKEKKKERDQIAEKLIQRFRLSALKDQRPATLSGGEKQRLALARVLGSKPKALLLDEPFSSLDSFLKWELEGELKHALADFSGDIIAVTHDFGEATRLCDNVLVLEDGKSGDIRETDALMKDPKTVGSAKLIGIKTFSHIRKIDENTVYCEDFDTALKVARDPEGFSFICIKDEDIAFARDEKENILSCTVENVVKEQDKMYVTLLKNNHRLTMALNDSDEDIILSEKNIKVYLSPSKLRMLY